MVKVPLQTSFPILIDNIHIHHSSRPAGMDTVSQCSEYRLVWPSEIIDGRLQGHSVSSLWNDNQTTYLIAQGKTSSLMCIAIIAQEKRTTSVVTKHGHLGLLNLCFQWQNRIKMKIFIPYSINFAYTSSCNYFYQRIRNNDYMHIPMENFSTSHSNFQHSWSFSRFELVDLENKSSKPN